MSSMFLFTQLFFAQQSNRKCVLSDLRKVVCGEPKVTSRSRGLCEDCGNLAVTLANRPLSGCHFINTRHFGKIFMPWLRVRKFPSAIHCDLTNLNFLKTFCGRSPLSCPVVPVSVRGKVRCHNTSTQLLFSGSCE